MKIKCFESDYNCVCTRTHKLVFSQHEELQKLGHPVFAAKSFLCTCGRRAPMFVVVRGQNLQFIPVAKEDELYQLLGFHKCQAVMFAYGSKMEVNEDAVAKMEETIRDMKQRLATMKSLEKDIETLINSSTK